MQTGVLLVSGAGEPVVKEPGAREREVHEPGSREFGSGGLGSQGLGSREPMEPGPGNWGAKT